MKKKPDTVRPQKTQKQGTINSARRQVKTKDDFFKELYENNNPTTLPKIATSNAPEKSKSPNDNTNELKSNPTVNTDSDSNTQFMGISKVNRSKEKTNKQSMASFKFNAKGLAAIKKDSSSHHRAQTIQSPKKLPPEQTIAVTSPKHSRPRTPTNTVVSSDLTNKSPKLFIPNFTTVRTSSNSSNISQSHSFSARPFPTMQPLFSTMQFDSLSTISNDKLNLFDDSDFDDPEFLENIISQIDNGTVTGCSLYFTSENQLEWNPCKVISFIPPNTFRIKFNLTGKIKEVPRISLRFDTENYARFEKRREAARIARSEIDLQLKQEAYLMARAEQINEPIESTLINGTMKRLTKKEKSNSLISQMLIEIQEQYDYAFAQIDYINLWEKNDQARSEFIKNGLKPIKFSSSEVKKVPEFHPIKKASIIVPNFKYLLEMVELLKDVENDPFYSYINKKSKKLSDFFKDFKFHFNTATSNARSIILNQLLSLSSKLTDKINDKDKRKSILLMINIRYRNSLSNLTIKSINHIIDPELTFTINSEEDPEKVDQNLNEIVEKGSMFIDEIYKTFIDNPVLEVDPNDLTNKSLNLNSPELDKVYKEALIKWKENVHENFKNYHDKIAEINKVTNGIPRDLQKKLKEILPDDFELVLDEQKNPSVDITTINYDLIRKELESSNNGLKEFLLNFEKNNFFQFKLFSFDVSKFFKKIQKMHQDFQSSVFNYLTSHSGFQLTRISEMISSLDEKCSKKAEDIEQWYEKSTLLLDVASNFQSLSKMLDQVSFLLSFMSDFYYEPTENGFVKLYQVKFQLFNVIKSLEKYKQQDLSEKSQFTFEHQRRKKQLQEELNNFKEEVSNFHNQDPTKDTEIINEKLKTKKKEFEELKKKILLYQKRDIAIGVEKTTYPIIESIQNDLNIFLPIWDIAVSLGKDVPRWLSTQFRELNVNLISDALIEWEKTLKKTVVQLGENHKMIPMLNKLINEVSDQIPHLQIVRAFCNPNLRSRHWNKISKLVKQEINPNDTITWHWMLESGVEDYIIGINAISRSADFEYKVEKTLYSIIDDLTSLKLRVNEVDGVVRLEDPTYAIEMLADHQKKIQDVMIPPYINPFLSKIKDYEVLASNVRKILKSTLDTQQKIDELKPAMDSKDLRVQHEEVCLQFDEQVAKFNDFTENFKLSLSFHQIVSNQKYVDLSKELSNEFEHLKKDLTDILDEKRKKFPRFYLLSDSQLVHLLSTCQNPSKSNELFNIMYPAISHALFNEKETECIGFVSIYNETLMLNKKVKITPEKVENWYSKFDVEIIESLRESTKVLLAKRSTRSEKLVLQYPMQIVQVANNIIFTSNITSCFDSFASTFSQNRSGQITGQFETVLNSINDNFDFLSQAYMKKPCMQLSAMLLSFINNRETVKQLIENKVDSPQNPIWYSKLKYVTVSDPEFDVIVKIGPSSYQYGFEFGLIRYPLPETKMSLIMNASLMLSMTSKIPTVLCGRIGISTIDTLINFTTLIGKMPLIIPCTNYLDFSRINQCLDVCEKVNSFIILKDLDHLNQETFNDLSIEVLRRKETMPNTMRIFATFSVVSECPEKLKLAFRPIVLKDFDAKDQFKALLSSCISNGNDYVDQLSTKLGSFVNNIAPAFFSKFNFIHPLKIIRTSIIDTFYEIYQNEENNNKIEPTKIGAELYKTIFNEFQKWYGGYEEFDQLQEVIDSIFDIKTKNTKSKNKSQIDEKLIQFENFVQSHFATILLGKPLSGKTVILNKALDEMKYKVEYINQHSFEPADLYGTENSGLISSLLPQTDIFVFDGILKNSELEAIVSGLEVPHYFTFGDNTKSLITEKNRFIFETDDISNASPALIGNCPIFFIGDDFLSLEDRLTFFLERKIKNESRLIDPFSQTIIGSKISVNELCKCITDFSHFFIPKMEVESTSPFTKLHCISNYFKYLQCSILNYYVTGNVKEKLKNTAENLIQDMPNLCLFSLFWAFAATCNDDNLNEFDEKLKLLFNSKYGIKIESIIESYFDQKKRKWMKWTDSGSELFPIESDDKNEDVFQLMTDISPRYLLIPLNLLIPALHITNILISEGYNVLICGSRNSSINNLILSTPNVSANFTPYSFSFPKEGTHKIIRKMIRSILPDSNSSHSFTVRKPLLSLYDFNPNFSASELMRFIIEHGYMLNDVSFVRNVVDGIRFVVSCRETDDFNQRLTHHMFVIRIPKPSDNVVISTLSHAISVLWGIQDKNNIISASLLKLLHESQYVFHFNIEHILSILQRVATVKMNKEPSFLVDAIAHESIAVFYNAFHSENILSSIQNAISTISKNYSHKEINVNEIAGKSLLTNLHSEVFRQISSFDDLNSNEEKISSSSKKEISKIKFISTDDSNLNLKINEKINEKIPNKIKQFDVLSIARTLSTPRTHLTINESCLSSINSKLINYACEIIKADLHYKRLDESLMKCFHDQFVNCGITKKHHVLFVTETTLNNDEKILLKQLVKSSDVFDLFERGEKLQLMTDLFSSGQNPFDDETYESMDGYNILLTNFLLDCQNYFHLCIVSNDKDVIRHTSIFKPFYGQEKSLPKLIESIKIGGGEIRERISNLHQIEPFNLYPYLLKYQNMKYFINSLKERIEKNSENLVSRKEIIDQIAEIGDELNEFMQKNIQEMEDLKTLLTTLSEEIELSSIQVEKMSKIAQSDAEKFEKQTKELNDQEIAADKLRKESQKQLSETKSILENASKELKALSSRDLAIIKTMNHPPHGVVLVVSAMCIVLDQPIDRSKDDEVVWNSAKKVLNDASFLNKLITKALDSLTPSVLDQLNLIISDPNFDPKVVQRASSAAKSICTFIRSVVPYYKALEVYKLRENEVQESESNLAKLRAQYEKAMEALSLSKKDVIDMQNKQNELKERKKSIETQIIEQSQKIEIYQKVEELMKPFFNQNKNEQKILEKNIKEIVNHCFLQQIIVDLLGPFNNEERNQIAKILTPKIGRYTYLPYEDDENVNKWETLHYPVSLFMKENTLMLTGSRWVAAVGIRKIPDSFIKQILGKNVICSLSILAPNFEEIFIFAIKRNQGIIIYDFDFLNPHPLVMLAFQAQQEKGPLNYTNSTTKIIETINIPDNFIVYFNIDRLIPSELINPLPPVRFVNLSIDASTTTEMIALKLFKLTNLRQTNEAAQIEREILSIKEQLSNSESAIRTLLVDSSTKIFSDKNMQWNFTNLVRKRNELVQLQRKLKQQHLWLFDDYPTLTLLARNLNEFFVPFKKQVSSLWSVFESEFERVKPISTDSLCHVAQTQIIGLFAASLPLVERVKTCAEAFGLKLDGSNSYLNDAENASHLPLSHSDDRLYLSSMMFEKNGEDEEAAEQGNSNNNSAMDDALNSSFDAGIRVSRSNDELTKEFNFLDSKGFDRLIEKLNEVTEGQIRELQCIPNIIKRTHPQRPVLIHTTSASYQMLAFLYIFKCEIVKIDDLIKTPNFIQNEAQKGSIVVTLCCSKDNLRSLLAAVSMVTASGFLAPSFRLVVFVVDLTFNSMTSFSPLFESRCDVISLDSPLSVKTVFSSTIKSLACEGQFTKKVTVPTAHKKPNGRPNKASSSLQQQRQQQPATQNEGEKPPLPNKAGKFDPFAAKLALFDASIVATHQLATLSKLPSFFAFRTALQCSSDATAGNFADIGEFIIEFIYGADSELGSHVGWLRKVWTKFNTFSSSSPSSPLKSPQKGSSESPSLSELTAFPNRFINSQYPVPISFSDRNIQKSLAAMPVLDDPRVFGFESYAFDFFKDHFFEGQNRQQFPSNSNPSICADSIENLDLLLATSNINSPTIKKSIKKLQSGRSQKKNIDASKVSSMTSLMSVANCLNKASCDFMTFEIKLDLIAGHTSNNLKRREQLVKAPKVLDISLIFQPRLMLDSILSQDFLEVKKFGRVITIKNGKDENKYSTSQPLHQRLFFSELFCKGAQFDSSSNVFRKFGGFSKLPTMEFVVTEMSDSLKPVRLIHNGNLLMTLYIRKETDDFDFVIFSYATKE